MSNSANVTVVGVEVLVGEEYVGVLIEAAPRARSVTFILLTDAEDVFTKFDEHPAMFPEESIFSVKKS
jgi:hypothetical protein